MMPFYLSRIQLVIITIIITLLSTYANRLLLVLNGNTAKGEVVSFVGVEGYESRHNTSTYIAPCIAFYNGKQQIVFVGESNLDLDRSEMVPVIYSKTNPERAFIYTFFGFWFLPIIYALLPIIVIVAIPLSFLKYKEGVLISLSPFSVKKRKRPLLELQ